ncbi:hypothetical protein BZA05DRAFT_3454 [Tricharina praecox]|uniref:uncharacterized protein n=1 Tax=Tricharina praecox TaxID=43433 RepID=UPI002220F919|nr:uncharacterized protein BZA05DRAFT_3454 [Tricharina praecox]KAI5858453.1 hypothetical protein BZA05DRAFT_3454 [Tricharina praecox]
MPTMPTPLTSRVFGLKRNRRLLANSPKVISKRPSGPKHIYRHGVKLTLIEAVEMGTTRIYMKPGAGYLELPKKEQIALFPLQRKFDQGNSMVPTNYEVVRRDNNQVENGDLMINIRHVTRAPGKENASFLPALRLQDASTTFKLRFTASTWDADNFDIDRFDFANGGKLVGGEMVECNESCLCKNKCHCANPQWIETRLNCDGTLKQYLHHGDFDDEAAIHKSHNHNIFLRPCGVSTCTRCEANVLDNTSQFPLDDSDLIF